ncbi:hypothetical protein, partial [Streptomyces fuscigenes]|uniref:hypothetical protein n=1 Tax=Streptomyces fuscigenes TaxID=1528880 RepID=UPI001F17E80E
WFGTKDNENAKVGPLNWWACVLLSLLAGAAFNAAVTPARPAAPRPEERAGGRGAAVPQGRRFEVRIRHRMKRRPSLFCAR